MDNDNDTTTQPTTIVVAIGAATHRFVRTETAVEAMTAEGRLAPTGEVKTSWRHVVAGKDKGSTVKGALSGSDLVRVNDDGTPSFTSKALTANGVKLRAAMKALTETEILVEVNETLALRFVRSSKDQRANDATRAVWDLKIQH